MTHLPSDFRLSTAALDHLVQAHWGVPQTVPAPRNLPQAPRIVLTGAAGFLGVHLLAELAITAPQAHLIGLVRDKSKVRSQLNRYRLDPALFDRVEWFEGDLATMDASLLPAADVLVHGAARIHGLRRLPALWQDNVAVVERLFRHYAAQGTRLHLVSTLSVFVSSYHCGRHKPLPLEPMAHYELLGGYAQTKYAAERVALGYGAQIVRLGLLTGSSTTGLFPPQDFFGQFLDTMTQLGVHPDDYEPAQVDITPVDLAASQLQAAVLSTDVSPIVHIANQESLALATMLKLLGTKTVSHAQFLEHLACLPRQVQVLLEYAFFKSESLQRYPDYFNIDLFQSTGHTYAIAEPFDVSNEDLLARYLHVRLAMCANNNSRDPS